MNYHDNPATRTASQRALNASDNLPDNYRELTPHIGGEVLDLHPGEIDDATFEDVYQLFLRAKVLVFRDANVSPAQQVEFAQRFGEVQVHVMNQYHADEFPELYRLSNLDEQGNPSGKHPDGGTLAWHTDGSWMRRTGLATFMYAEEVPKPGRGGETHFCDMYEAWQRLSDADKDLLGELRAIHNLDFSRNRRHGSDPMTLEQRAKVPPVDHPIKRCHPDTGRYAVFLGDHAEHIQGMEYQAGRDLIERINSTVIHDDLIYQHHWRDSDFVVWDNRAVQHRATSYDTARDRRVIRRCTVLGDPPSGDPAS